VPVTVRALPVTTITKSNDIDCTFGQTVLHATGDNYYVWDSLPGITSFTSANPVVTPLINTTYYVTVTGRNGCSIRDSIDVLVDLTKAISKFPVANAFTPNNDGKNDCFGLKYWSRITSMQFEIFNRWGQRVFFTSDPTGCWDGTYNGVPQPPGGYIYQIRATTICGTATRKGMVLLIR
jgi:gliding motility-associated-like protein